MDMQQNYLVIFCSEDFRNFADVCFKEFGERVKHWVTLNKPYSHAFGGYVKDIFPPVRCTKPYIVAHNFLLSNDSADKLYKDKYQVINFTRGPSTSLVRSPKFIFIYVSSTSASNRMAAQQALDFMFRWSLTIYISFILFLPFPMQIGGEVMQAPHI
ncbi:Vicianin hydrolase [Nymphaea thermarum]|nr:Vicianin hydrolase [Nymphaea thermarum]